MKEFQLNKSEVSVAGSSDRVTRPIRPPTPQRMEVLQPTRGSGAVINKVQQSGIVVYDLSALWDGKPVMQLDISSFLVGGLVLREKTFRKDVQQHPWPAYTGAHVGLYCTTDAIVPTWAWMLITAKLADARSVTFGRKADVLNTFFARALEAEDWTKFANCIVVVKGCGSDIVPHGAYVTAMRRLIPVARKVMYGEPCSNVPLWRR